VELVVWGYFAVAPSRTPAFEVWGITLRIIQVPLFAALVLLALRTPEPRVSPGHGHARIGPAGPPEG
jgi:hypothetical protein